MADYQPYEGRDPFTYQAPTEQHIKDITKVRDACRELYATLLQHVKSSPERTLAIRKLEEVSMWANKAIVFEVPDSA